MTQTRTGNAMTSYTTIVDANNDTYINGSDEVATLTEFDGAGRIRKTRTENPNSTGGYTGKLVEYNILGQLKRETVPTEINSSWNPAGDDYRGMSGSDYIWLWNTKEYDWKGRVKRTIPSDSNGSDGKDTLIEYDGCGCAGGQVTTIKGPVTAAIDVAGNPQTTKRRWQKVYEDILGRTYKTELLDLDGGSVYSTVKTTFNGRDQATLIRQYAGADTSSTYQDTTMTYDGHGRLYQKHLPQGYGSTTTYNVDDTVATSTDARGAVTTYTYENVTGTPKRPLVTGIAYAPPSPNPTPGPTSYLYIPDVPDVAFSYDAAGNRSQMTDGTGTLGYEYDELSRLKKETKDFADNFGNGPATFSLEYEYHLSGGLKSITDPFDYVTTYGADKIGRMVSIGDSTSYNAYVSGISHRAFGGIKQMVINTAEQTTVSVGYNTGLRPASYVATNGANEGDIQNAAYDYHNDGLVKDVDNEAEPRFDQTSKYDFAGRLKMNSAGPVSQQLKYDAFNNLTERENNFWGYEDRFVAGYTNNRKTSSPAPVYDTYDNAGNVVESLFNPYTPHGDRPYNDSKWWMFDAAGRTTYFSQYTTASGTAADARETKHDTAFDGDGRLVKENKRERMCGLAKNPEECTGTWVELVSHYLISSVTGQKITTLYDGANGEKHIYMGQTNIAREVPDGEEVHRSFTTTDPVTGSTAPMVADGTVSLSDRTELAALGTAIPLSEPPPSLPPPSNYENGHVGDAEHGCTDPIADTPMPCNLLAFMVNSDYFKIPVRRDRDGRQIPDLPNDFIGADNRPMGWGKSQGGSGYPGLYHVGSTEEGGSSKWIVEPNPPPLPQGETCGVNPVTQLPGILNPKRDPITRLRPGGLGGIRPGNGGAGGFRERSGDKHDAVDIAAPVGTDIVANLSGTVINAVSGFSPANTAAKRSAQFGGLGNIVIIDHGGFYTLYAHLSGVSVNVGDTVSEGSIIGTAGRTGNANNKDQPSQDDHVHFGFFEGQVKANGLPVNKNQYKNPVSYLNSRCPPRGGGGRG